MPSPGTVLGDLRFGGRCQGWRWGRGGGGVSPSRAPAARIRHQVLHCFGARAAGQEGEEVPDPEAPPFAGRRHVARAVSAGPAWPPEGPPSRPSDPRARSLQGAATGTSAHAAGSGAEAGLQLRLGSECGRGGVRRGGGARTRKEAEPEAEVRVKDPPDSRARAEAGPEARVLPTPLGLVPRPEPGGRGPWRGSRFLQKSSVLWKVRRGRAVDSDGGRGEVRVAILKATIAPSDRPACL